MDPGIVVDVGAEAIDVQIFNTFPAKHNRGSLQSEALRCPPKFTCFRKTPKKQTLKILQLPPLSPLFLTSTPTLALISRPTRTIMDRIQHSLDLHLAAIRGDDAGVRMALDSGADINAIDNCGRTVLAAAIAGDDWEHIDASDASFMNQHRLNVIRMLLRHKNITLFTLNAPQSAMNGVTPLGMAAWLNMAEAVKALLHDSMGTVSVDGMDSHGATALMYAARDGNLEVVKLLLHHGARPDFRDVNHRTSIQYSLSHPQILWLCEAILRRHRWRESQTPDRNRLSTNCEKLLDMTAASFIPFDTLDPPPSVMFSTDATSRSTKTLVESVVSSELSFLHSLLFAPPPPPSSTLPALYPLSCPLLVNNPDFRGWSPIHHCVSVPFPSVDILDALYCAGADVSAFTTHEHYTPLHCLALSSHISNERHESYSHSPLYQFVVHLIYDLRAPLSARDANDETCIHIAAEHGDSLELLLILLECDVSGTVRELRNARGLTALDLALDRPEFRAAFGEGQERPVSSMSTRTVRPVASLTSIVSFTKWTSGRPNTPSETLLPSEPDLEMLTPSQQLLEKLRQMSPANLHSYGVSDVNYLTGVMRESAHLSESVIRAFRTRIDETEKELQETRKAWDKMSALLDIVTYGVDDRLEERGFEVLRIRERARDSEDSQATAVSHELSLDANNASAAGLSTDDRPKSARCFVSVSTQTPPEKADPKGAVVHGGEEKRIDSPFFVATKLKAWVIRKLKPEKTLRLEIVREIDEVLCMVGRDTLEPPLIAAEELDDEALERRPTDIVIDDVLRTSHLVLDAAYRDLRRVDQCLLSIEQLVNKAAHSTSRAERLIKRAFKTREMAISLLRNPPENAEPDLFIRPGSSSYTWPISPSLSSRSSRSSLSSPALSYVSLPDTLAETEDEDIRAIRRLLMRRIEAQIGGAIDEVDRVHDWLRTIKEVARGIKRRAYL